MLVDFILILKTQFVTDDKRDWMYKTPSSVIVPVSHRDLFGVCRGTCVLTSLGETAIDVTRCIKGSFILSATKAAACEPVWPSGKALGW